MEQRAIPLRCVINSNAKLLSNWELLLWDAENSTQLDEGEQLEVLKLQDSMKLTNFQ